MITKNKRFNWRIKEETAAEFSHTYRNGGFRSWDEFIRELLELWNNQQKQTTVTSIEQEITSIKNTIEKLVERTGHFSLLLEGQIEALHSLHLAQEQLIALVDRLNNFLELAFEMAGEKLATQDNHGKFPDEDVIDKIRNHQL